MNALHSGKRPSLPEVRVACFCDQVIQGADDTMSVIRIIDRVTVDLSAPLPIADRSAEPIRHDVTFFAMIDGVRPWSGQAIEIWAKPPGKAFERRTIVPLGSEAETADTVNLILATGVDLRRPGRFVLEVRLAGRRLARRQLELAVMVANAPAQETSERE